MDYWGQKKGLNRILTKTKQLATLGHTSSWKYNLEMADEIIS